MKKYIILLTVFLLCFSAKSQTRRALVIGIGKYKDTKWEYIGGDNDIDIVKDMLTANKFSTSNIVTLKNEQATLKGINLAFTTLTQHCQKGDIVYIHFSGHGQQIPDCDYDEEDRLDEAFVAYDTPFYKSINQRDYQGKYHFTDDTLYNILLRIKNIIGNNGKLIVVNDACKSGGGDRGSDDETTIPTRGHGPYYLWDQHDDKKSTEKPAIDCIYISSCKGDENAFTFETTNPKKQYGAMTYALWLYKGNLSTMSVEDTIIKLETFLKKYLSNTPYQQTPTLHTINSELRKQTLF